MIPTTKDTDRLKKSLIEYIPDRVYILYNKDPMEEHEKVNQEALDIARDLVRENTLCYSRGEVVEKGIGFYHFDEALVDIFGLMYEESERGNDVFVNVSGGTKPVAIALTYCCSMFDAGTPMYYAPQEYNDGNSQADTSSVGVIEPPFELEVLDLTDIVPEDEEKELLLSELSQYSEPVGVTDLLANKGIIQDKPPKDREDKKDRNNTQTTYHGHMGTLLENNLVQKNEKSKYELSDDGELIADLVKERNKVRKELKHK